jgi:hypothetical protein
MQMIKIAIVGCVGAVAWFLLGRFLPASHANAFMLGSSFGVSWAILIVLALSFFAWKQVR